MKTILLFLFTCVVNIVYYMFLFWVLPKKVLCFPHGWDTLHPFAPYSYGGVPRKEFLRLYKQKKVTSSEYTAAEYGSLTPSTEQTNKKYRRSEYVKKIFW